MAGARRVCLFGGEAAAGDAVASDFSLNTYNYLVPLGQVPVGGRLLHFFHQWSTLTDNQSVLEIIRDGYCLEFESQPPQGLVRLTPGKPGQPNRRGSYQAPSEERHRTDFSPKTGDSSVFSSSGQEVLRFQVNPQPTTTESAQSACGMVGSVLGPTGCLPSTYTFLSDFLISSSFSLLCQW